MIKTSTHTTKFANKEKQSIIVKLLNEYRCALEFYINFLWNNLDKQAKTPKFISTKDCFPSDTSLSQRALKCAATQACAMTRAATEKRRKQLYMLKKLMRAGSDTRNLQRKIDKTPLVKPSVPKEVHAELNSICAKLHQSTNSFDNWAVLQSLGKSYGKIIIPLKQTKHSRKLQRMGKTMTSFLISKSSIQVRYDITKPELKARGHTLGADQGVITVLSLSDSQTTSACCHNHSLHSICQKLARKTKGSKAFKRAQDHRTNYINWSIKQLNLDDVKEIKLEKLFQMRSGQHTSRFLSHFAYTKIRSKLTDLCELRGIKLVEQDNVYRSQRCSSCGYVHRSNRKGKTFICRSCGATHDADINAAKNHEVDLVELPAGLRHMKKNLSGFWWSFTGVTDSYGQDITVPVVEEL